ncbi:unnamed protein product, partial [Discosporangium mesarthrocarpum]
IKETLSLYPVSDPFGTMTGESKHPASGSNIQAVIMAYDDGARLYPLTQDTPAVLLPVLNKPLLHYQLELLEKATYTDALVVCSRVTEAPVAKFLEAYQAGVAVEQVVVDSSQDTAQVLRQIREHIRGDFLLLPGNLVCEEVLGDLAKVHSRNKSDITMVLKEEAPVKDTKGRKIVRPKRDEEDIDYVGLTKEGRLVIKLPALYVGEVLRVQKALLRQSEALTISTSLQDVNVALLAHRVLDFLEERRDIASVQNELIPALVRRQFHGSGGSGIGGTGGSTLGEGEKTPGPEPGEEDGTPSAGSSGGTNTGEQVRCFALTLRHEDAYCCQAKTLPAFHTMNRELLTGTFDSPKCPWSMPEGFRKKDASLVVSTCSLGTK